MKICMNIRLDFFVKLNDKSGNGQVGAETERMFLLGLLNSKERINNFNYLNSNLGIYNCRYFIIFIWQ